MEKHEKNAAAIVKLLSEHPKIDKVYYPGLPSHPTADTARRQFPKGCGGMLTLRVGSKEKAYAFIDALQLTDISVNFGDSRTLAIHPGETIYRHLTAEEKEEAGVYPDLIRVSVGLEHSNDIIADFEQALEKI